MHSLLARDAYTVSLPPALGKWRLMACALLFTVLSLPAQARQEDGTLGLIVTPNNGVPALLTAGGQL